MTSVEANRGAGPTAPQRDPVLQVRDLRTRFVGPQGEGIAVNGVGFDLHRGETLGLVGESGSGKSITALSIMRLLPRGAAETFDGSVHLNGVDLLGLDENGIRQQRGRHISMVLQDPLSALNPVLTIGEQIMEPLRLHHGLSGRALRDRAVEMLRLLHVPAADTRLRSYPHEFSGGMRQRVVGAIALACEPEVLIADEPTTALDVTIQAQYLRLLRQIQRRSGLAIVFITHDFGIVARMCDRVAVMYAGRIVEIGETRALFRAPQHPYTRALLESVPELNVDRSMRLRAIEGTPPSIWNMPAGCPFADRCPETVDRCRAELPPEREAAPGHSARCWLHP